MQHILDSKIFSEMNNLTVSQHCERVTGISLTDKQRQLITTMHAHKQSYLQFHLNAGNTVSWYLVDDLGNLFTTISDKKAKPLEYAGILSRIEKGYVLHSKFKNL